jgi:hypothetical protein
MSIADKNFVEYENHIDNLILQYKTRININIMYRVREFEEQRERE